MSYGRMLLGWPCWPLQPGDWHRLWSLDCDGKSHPESARWKPRQGEDDSPPNSEAQRGARGGCCPPLIRPGLPRLDVDAMGEVALVSGAVPRGCATDASAYATSRHHFFHSPTVLFSFLLTLLWLGGHVLCVCVCVWCVRSSVAAGCSGPTAHRSCARSTGRLNGSHAHGTTSHDHGAVNGR